MNQVHSLEHAINLANHMTTSDALWKADQNKGKKLLELLEDPKENIDTIKIYKEHLKINLMFLESELF